MSDRAWSAPVLWRFGNGRELEGGQRSSRARSIARPKAVEDNRSPRRCRALPKCGKNPRKQTKSRKEKGKRVKGPSEAGPRERITHQYTTKTDIVETNLGMKVVAKGNTQNLRAVAPGTALQHPYFLIRKIPAIGPVPNVAGHFLGIDQAHAFAKAASSACRLPGHEGGRAGFPFLPVARSSEHRRGEIRKPKTTPWGGVVHLVAVGA